jgi:P2 family phage contractile tail tube protein
MQANVLNHCNVYGDGNNFLGQFEEVTLPEIKNKSVDHRAGDMIGTRTLPTSLEKMEATLKGTGLYEDFYILIADPDQMVSLQVRANLKKFDGQGLAAEVPVVVYLKGWFPSRKAGTLKNQDPAKPEYKMELSYYKLVVDGAELEEVDVDNHIHRVNGVDLLAQFRSNLGLS